MSMVFLGSLSFFIALAGTGSCLTYDITLLARSAKDRRLDTNISHPVAETMNTPSYPPARSQSPREPLPCTLGKPSIIAVFVLIIPLWVGALVGLLYFLSHFERLDLPNSRIIAVPILEVVFTVAHIGVLGTYGVLACKERRAWASDCSTLKWYQLGEYSA
jgi:hypothetical protein